MKNRIDIGKIVNLLAIMLSWALMSLLAVIFYTAFFNPSHQVVIDINSRGEMMIEAIMLVPIWMLATWSFLKTWKSTW